MPAVSVCSVFYLFGHNVYTVCYMNSDYVIDM